jgi:hypothetical protein
VDKTGEFIISPQFLFADGFSEGLAAVNVPGWFGADASGFIDKAGNFAIKPQFYGAESFSEGLACVWLRPRKFSKADNQSSTFIDKSGGVVLNVPFVKLPLTRFSEGLLLFLDHKAEKCGFIDTNGRVVIKPTLTGPGCCFSEGLLDVALERDKCGYINKTGEVVIDYKFLETRQFSEGLAAVRGPYWHKQPFHTWGYIDKTGSFVFQARFACAGEFSEGLAPVAIYEMNTDNPGMSKRKWGFIDKTGNWVIKPRFEFAYSFSNGLASVAIGSKWGYIDKTGSFVIKPQFEYAWPFSEGLARVEVAE